MKQVIEIFLSILAPTLASALLGLITLFLKQTKEREACGLSLQGGSFFRKLLPANFYESR